MQPALELATPARVPADLLQRHDVQGPRYTSYPTADRFVDTFRPDDYVRALQRRAEARSQGRAAPLSLYVHVPFCESICFYCACNKVITRHHERASAYLGALEAEMALNAAVLGPGGPVSQLHLGGGTPTFLSDGELERLMASIRAAFGLVPGAETSIEVDPRTVDAERLRTLHRLGFNRLSLGVQDFDPDVQKAVNRIQPFERVRDLMHDARAIGFESVNVDLIYGLPRQTPATFRTTIRRVQALRPDRIALYAYAHLPHRFKPQRRIAGDALPVAAQRVAMLDAAVEGFSDAGYVYIGMDHFALPDDALAVAKRLGRLHRNFQGYSTQPDCDLIGLGVSAIGRMGDTYSQNEKTLPAYYDALREGRLPVARGIALDADDLVRRDVIMAIMCRGRVDLAAIGEAHGIDAHDYFQDELARCAALATQGLVTLEPAAIEVTPVGWYFVRAVAMAFDRHLRASEPAERFSRIV
jgi:oxygen-independent coproporphyrinogen-3 oxidase